jgi:RimJ/RimL family protein N-acetyltransferase
MTKTPTPSHVQLRDMSGNDLPIFFEQQLDPAANYMAAFTAKDPTDRVAFNTHWAKVLADRSITIKTILYDGQVAGSILSHAWSGEPEISYWLGKEYWGKGIATKALELFLEVQKARPLYARVAKDNIASLHVLNKSGFAVSGESKWFSNARSQEVDELILVLK